MPHEQCQARRAVYKRLMGREKGLGGSALRYFARYPALQPARPKRGQRAFAATEFRSADDQQPPLSRQLGGAVVMVPGLRLCPLSAESMAANSSSKVLRLSAALWDGACPDSMAQSSSPMAPRNPSRYQRPVSFGRACCPSAKTSMLSAA